MDCNLLVTCYLRFDFFHLNSNVSSSIKLEAALNSESKRFHVHRSGLMDCSDIGSKVHRSPFRIEELKSFLKRLYETTPKWHGFLMIKLAETVNRLNVEHRTLNVERPILMALRFIYFITSEPQNIE